MRQEPIGSLHQPVTAELLEQVLRQMTQTQGLCERMVMRSAHGSWHLALTRIFQTRKGLHQKTLQSLAQFAASGVTRESAKDSGSRFIADLALDGPEQTTRRADVVLSWGSSVAELDREVESIRRCLDVLGLFDQPVTTDRFIAWKKWFAKTPMGELELQPDTQPHRVQVSGTLKLGNILAAAIGHLLPGMASSEMGGAASVRLPHQDSRDKFISAMLALQWESQGALQDCNVIQQMWGDVSAESEILKEYAQDVSEGLLFLEQSMQAIDVQMQKAFAAHPLGERNRTTYRSCRLALENGKYERAIQNMSYLQSSFVPVREVMGDAYYLFAANIIMQVQLRLLKEALGQALQATPPAPPSAPASPVTSPFAAPGSTPRRPKP